MVRKNKDKNINLIAIFLILSLVVFYFINKNAKKEDFSVEEVVSMVDKLIVLPKDEIPTIATVTKENIIKEGGFFEGAKVGDKVLIYPNARKAVLFDIEANKVINIAPLNLKSE